MNLIRLQFKKICSLGIIGALGFYNAADLSAQVSLVATGGTPTATYASLNEAFAGINNGVHTGAITLNITANTSEPTTITPLESSGTGQASYTSILIQPQGGAYTITTATARAAGKGLIELHGADNVTINGDPNNTGVRQLTFEMPTGTIANTVIRLASKETNGTNGASNNTIKNCIIIGGRSAVNNTTLTNAITFNHSTSTSNTGTAAYANNNNIIENNLIQRAYIGINLLGHSTQFSLNNIIRKNKIGATTASLAVGQRGIKAQNASNAANPLIIEDNDISIGDVSISGSGFSSTIAGIELAEGNAGAIIQRNNLHDIYQPSTSGYGAYAIFVSSSTNNNDIIIRNNFIRDMVTSKYSTTRTSSFVAFGFYSSSAITRLKFNHNTIALLQEPTTGTVAQYAGGGFMLNSSSAAISEFYGNSIHVNYASSNAFAVYLSAASVITNAGMNYNNYIVDNNAYVAHTSSSAAHRTLADFKSATNKDGNSISVRPPYVSNTDIHISNTVPTLLESGGPPVALVNNNTDFDNQTRPGPTNLNGGGLSTDIGADEFDGRMLSCYMPNQVTTTNVTSTSITLKWVAPATGPANGYAYYISTSPTDPTATTTPTGTVATGVDSVVITNLQPVTTYYLWVKSICSATEQSDWTFRTSTTTGCDVFTTWSENFDNMATGAILPQCWIRIANGSGTLSINTTSPSSTPNNLYFYSASASNTVYAILPQLANINAGTHWLQYKARSSSATTAARPIIGYITDVANIATFVPLDTLTVSNGTYNSYFSYFAPPTTLPANARLVIYNGNINSTGFYFDDFEWLPIPNCVAPLSTRSSLISTTSGNIIWDASISNPASYEYYYSTNNTAPTATTTPSGVSNTTNALLNTLTPETKYYFWVRSVCNATTKSSWTTIDSFYTGYCIPTFGSTSPTGATYIDSLVTTNVARNISKLSTGYGTNGYNNFAATDTLMVSKGDTVKNNMFIVGGSAGVAVYVDTNNDLTFSLEERFYTSASYKNGAFSFDYIIPNNLPNGHYRLRYVLDFNSQNPNACNITTARGEMEDYTLVVSCNPNSPINLGANTAICTNDTIVLNPNATVAGGAYLWNTNDTTATISVATPGTYSVRYTLPSGCIYNDTIVVTMAAPPVVNLGLDTAFCSGDTLTLDAGNAGLSFLWNTNETTQTINVTNTGTYYVTVANGNCVTTDTIHVTVNQTPVVDLGADTTFCSASNFILDAGNTGATYLWNTNDTTQTYHVTAAGTYSVTVRNGNCVATDTIVVGMIESPIVNLGNDTTLCNDARLYLDVAHRNATYLWQNNSRNSNYTVTTAGTYWVELSNNGCKASDTIHVSYARSPIVDLGADTFACLGNAITLDAGNAGLQYLWNNNSTNQTITVNASGIYSVAVTNQSGCVGTDSVQVNFNDGPYATGINVVPMTNGQYMFSVNAGSFIDTYRWSFGDGDSATVGTIPHQFRADGTYTVSVTITNDCGDTTLYTTVTVAGLSIDQILKDDAVKVYPNPTKNQLYVSMTNEALIQKVVVYNILGQEVMSTDINNRTDANINMNTLADGIYQVMILTDQGFTYKKVQKIQ